jgi:chromate transporter
MLWKLFLAFLKVGTLGFGSGPSMLVLIEREMRDLGVMDSTQFADAVALNNALPGPIATKMTQYCGCAAAGPLGGVVALVGMLLPSLIGVFVLFQLVENFRGNARMEAALKALKPVVVAFFLFLAVNSSRGLRPSWDTLLLGAVALGLLLIKVEPAWIVLGALAVGLLLY